MVYISAGRRGFTLVELLVVIAIIGVLVALLLPAVQMARESARRMSCTNNLKNLALAVHNYHDAVRMFPASVYGYKACDPGAGITPDPLPLNVAGWVGALAYLEQGSITANYNFQQAASHATSTGAGNPNPLVGDAVTSGNGKLFTQKLPIFLCPTDPTDPFEPADSTNYSIKVGSGLRGARINYDFSTNCSIVCNFWKSLKQGDRNMFGENSDTRISNVEDGTSNTIMLGETTRDVVNGNGQLVDRVQVPASRRERVTLLGDEVIKGIGGFISGALTVAFVAGFTSYIFLLIIGLPYALALALFVALLDLVPLIGATIAAVVVSLIGFTQSLVVGFTCVVFYIAYQQFENYVVYPRVMRRAVDVPAPVTVVAVLLGGALLGVVGALLAIPVAAAVLLILRQVAIPRMDQV